MQVMSIVRDTTEHIRDDMAKLLKASDDQKREQSKQRGSGEQKSQPFAAEYSKHPSAKGIRNTLMGVEGEDHEDYVLQETIVPDTCAWVFREPEWERWLNQQDPPNTVLVITGSPGTGKSHLAFSVYQALKSEEATKDASRRTCVAQFYFREQNESLLSFANGVISVFNQVAEQSPELCEAMYEEIELSSKPPLKIEIAKEKQINALITIIRARINSLSTLKKLSRYVQQRVADKTEEIAPKHPGIKSTGQGVREYAVNHVLHHWRDIEAEHLNVEQQTELMETFASLMLDKSSFTRIQEEELKITFYHDERFDDLFFDRLRSWAALLLDAKVPLSAEDAEWWTLIAERPRDCLLQLAKSHVRRLQDAVDLNSAEASFSAANGALRIVSFGKDSFRELCRPNRQCSVLMVSLETSAWALMATTGYHWLAALQFLYKKVQPAESTCLKAMTYSQTPLERVQSLELLSRIPQIETKLQDAAASYELARSNDPSNLVMCDALRAQMKLFENETCKQGFIVTLKTWSPLERLAYLCWDTWDSVYKAVIRAAVESGEVAFIVQMYPDSIRLLEQVNASAPLLVELGFLHINATRDLEAARAVFDQALDSGSTGWPYAVAGEALEATLDTANTFQSEVLYRLFRESADRKRKRELLGAVEGLHAAPRPGRAADLEHCSAVSPGRPRPDVSQTGPVEKFHQTLQGVVDSCVAALSDTVGWNDRDNLICLAMSLSILGGTVKDGQGLKRAAQVLLSAQMSRLDPNVNDDNERYGEEERSDYGSDGGGEKDSATRPKGDDGDLDDDVVLFCDGGCVPTAKFTSWAGRVSYLCLVCSECFLCEDYYKCPLDHEYIEAPIKGCKGVVDGGILLEGEEPVVSRDYLQHIREELCKEAWESFWRQQMLDGIAEYL
ncbi:hypothetical protein CGCSCA5_v009622 [Colletotrichum siamense]|nr:hypothetical protein CGCSCA5_v009622 [Colletotrichum siamense]KAF4871318.1 hypothetical protein CGCSCA1_v009417 [Colletotrichum siamense]